MLLLQISSSLKELLLKHLLHVENITLDHFILVLTFKPQLHIVGFILKWVMPRSVYFLTKTTCHSSSSLAQVLAIVPLGLGKLSIQEVINHCHCQCLLLLFFCSLVNPIHAGVFLVLLFKIHVAPRKKIIRWNSFEKS